MEIKLIIVKTKKDQDGFPVSKECEVTVFAEEKSVTRTEMYESMKAGVTVKTVYELRQEDWELVRRMADKRCVEKVKDFDENIYRIIRTYKVGKAKIELVCG